MVGRLQWWGDNVWVRFDLAHPAVRSSPRSPVLPIAAQAVREEEEDVTAVAGDRETCGPQTHGPAERGGLERAAGPAKRLLELLRPTPSVVEEAAQLPTGTRCSAPGHEAKLVISRWLAGWARTCRGVRICLEAPERWSERLQLLRDERVNVRFGFFPPDRALACAACSAARPPR